MKAIFDGDDCKGKTMTTHGSFKAVTWLFLIVFLCYAFTVSACADYVHGYFRYTISDGSVTITAYTGDEAVVTVPAMIAGYPVSTIASGAFADCPEVTTVYLPETVTSVQGGAFAGQGVVHLSSRPADSGITAAENPAPTTVSSSGSDEAQGSDEGSAAVIRDPAGSSGSTVTSGGGNNQPASGNAGNAASVEQAVTVTSGKQNSGLTEVDIEDVNEAAPTAANAAPANGSAEETAEASEAAEKPEMMEITAPEQQSAVSNPEKAEKRSVLPVVLGLAVLIVLICIMLILRSRRRT